MKQNIRFIKRPMVSKSKMATMFASALLFGNLLAFSSQNLASIYEPKALVLNAILILFILIFEITEITKEDGLLFFSTIVFLSLEIFVGDTSIGSASAILFIIFTITAFKHIKISIFFWRAILIPTVISLIYVMTHSRNYWSLFSLSNQGIIVDNVITINPNTLSVFLLISYIILCLYFEKKKVSRCWRWLLRGGLLTLNYLLKCRTGMGISLLIIIGSLVIPYKFWFSKRFALCAYASVLLGGISFPRIFCILSENDKINYFIYGLTGKFLFTGREQIWTKFYEHVDMHLAEYLFGVGTHNVEKIIGNSSIHNSYLWIMSNCGIIGIILFFIFILLTVNKAYKNNVNKLTVICIWGYLLILLNFYTEATICYGFTTVMMNMILGLANNYSLNTMGELNETDKSNSNYGLL
ncbi:MAG: hypothetical protein KH441_03610 [Clostridium sp.]|nr:hypothetical protein [Clostridium sp.]